MRRRPGAAPAMNSAGSPRPQGAAGAPRAADDLAVVLPGGGARGAYQVGVLRWIAQRYPDIHFPIVTGVSAGAISAAFLAAWPGAHAAGIAELHRVWSGLTLDRIFRADAWSLGGRVARWGARLLGGGSTLTPAPRGLVDHGPLAATLREVFDIRADGEIAGIAENVAAGRLWALALVTSHYGSGQSVVWTAGRDLADWRRPDRHSRRAVITLDHILASSALPLIFPAVRLVDGWHGDGGIRLTAPCSPALHLGANRVLAVSTRYEPADPDPEAAGPGSAYPPPLQISGQLMKAVFLDGLDRDALELERVNRLLREVPPSRRRGLRPVQLVVIRPSVDIGKLAAEHEPRLPPVLRHLVRGLGSREVAAPDLLSLLAFQPEYLGRLIAIGEADAADQADQLDALLAG